jgi:hypothetical protein
LKISSLLKSKIIYILGALVLLEIADGILTNVLIKKDIAREANPFLVGIAGTTGFMIIKIIGVLLAVVILLDINQRYPRLAFWVAVVFLLVYCGIVAWNASLLMPAI